MLKFYFKQKLEENYKREISLILQKIRSEIPSFSINKCFLNREEKKLILFIYFLEKNEEENEKKLINKIQKETAFKIKKELFKTNKFSYVPNISFYLDEEIKTMIELKELLKKNKL